MHRHSCDVPLERDEVANGTGLDRRQQTHLIERRSMATTGYSDLKEFQRIEVVVSPYQPH